MEVLHMPANAEYVTRLAYVARVSQASWTSDYSAGNTPRRKVSHGKYVENKTKEHLVTALKYNIRN